jgi:hypothetical protein
VIESETGPATYQERGISSVIASTDEIIVSVPILILGRK